MPHGRQTTATRRDPPHAHRTRAPTAHTATCQAVSPATISTHQIPYPYGYASSGVRVATGIARPDTRARRHAACRTGASCAYVSPHAVRVRVRLEIADLAYGRTNRGGRRTPTGRHADGHVHRESGAGLPTRLCSDDAAASSVGPGVRPGTASAASELVAARAGVRSSRRRERARVYEIVLREGTPDDILRYVDGALLCDLWPELVLPNDLRSAWQPIIDTTMRAA